MHRNGTNHGQESAATRKAAEGEHVESAATRENYRLLPLLAMTAALILLCIVLAVPFLPAITWGIALAIIAWPLHTALRSFLPWPSVAAAVAAFLVFLAIVGAGFFVTYQLVAEAESMAEHIEASAGGLKDQLTEIPGVSRVTGWMEQAGVDIESEVRTGLGSLTQNLTALSQGSLYVAIQFLIAFFILYHLFRDRAEVLQGVRRLLPLTREESEKVFRSAADSVHANLYANLVTSLIYSVSGALVFWAVGLPAPVLWGVVIFVLSLLPLIGAGIVWVPAAAYLAMTGRGMAALILVSWGVAAWLILDYVIFVRIAGKRMRMHQVPALIAFLGGVAVFGASGMILGPAILAVTMAFLQVWKDRLAQSEEDLCGETRDAPSARGNGKHSSVGRLQES